MSFARKLKRKTQNKRKHSTEDDKMIRKRYGLLINYQDPFLNKMIRPIDDMQERVCCDCAHKAECGLKYRQIATCPHVVERYLR
jgi:hypothetical protein